MRICRIRSRRTQGVLLMAVGTAVIFLLHNYYFRMVIASSHQQGNSYEIPHSEETLADVERSIREVVKSKLRQSPNADETSVSNEEQSAESELAPADFQQSSNSDANLSVSDSDESTPDIESVMQARQAHIRSVCAAKNYPDFKQSNSYYFPSYHFSWVPVYKAGSTTWKKFFIDTTLTHPKNYHIVLLAKYHMSQSSIVRSGAKKRRRAYRREPEDITRFTIVRHPLSRLVSHYRKTVRGEMDALADLWVKGTIEHSRESPEWEKEVKERYQREMDLYLKGKMSPEDSPDNPYLSPPSFPEFVSFILYARAHKDSRGDNVHWKPAAMWADICQMEIDIVAKLENEKDELPYLLEKLGLSSDLLGRFLTKENASGGKEVAGSEVRELISELSENDQKDLNEIYQLDYEIFEYEPVYSSVT